MRHIISFSTGLSSALTCERVLTRYGKEAIVVVFMDTTIEDEDNYRFMADCKAKWGIPITILCDGRTPYQVAEDEHIIPNQKIAPCTYRLKIELFSDWLQAQNFEQVTIHIGYDIFEAHRCEATEKNYSQYGWLVDFPLLWKPIEYRSYSQVVREDWGIEPPRMYDQGYSHANCGGCCVKQGQGDWLRTLINFPERFQAIESWEQQMRQHPKRKEYAILRNQSNGEVKPLTLRELRLKHEKSQITQPMLFNLDSQSACVYCGVGDLACDPGAGGLDGGTR